MKLLYTLTEIMHACITEAPHLESEIVLKITMKINKKVGSYISNVYNILIVIAI